MKTLDDSWNAKELTTFHKRHSKNCVVRWPNQPPTHGIEAHEQEALAFFKTFPDQHLVNNPYKVMVAQRDWTCTIAEFTGTMTGLLAIIGKRRFLDFGRARATSSRRRRSHRSDYLLAYSGESGSRSTY
jgi:hypothetical protein